MPPKEVELRARDATAALLDERERKSLRWSILARLSLMVITIVVVLPVTGKAREDVALLAVMLPAGALQLWVLRRLRDEGGELTPARIICAATDVGFVVLLPALWHAIYTTPEEPLVHLTRHNYTVVCTVFMALNVASLRPALPALITVASVLMHVLLAALALTDPRLSSFDGGMSAAMGVGLGTGDLLVVTPFFLAITGVLLTLSARAARNTVLEAVALQQAERDARERQLEAVLDARMAALGELVAGVEHEVNNPLGAMRSATDTGTRAAERLRDALAATGAPLDRDAQRALSALQQALELSRQGSARISDVMATIRGFVQLDGADVQRTDLAAVLRDVLALVGPSLRADTELVTELQEGVVLQADPRRLAQALSTVVRNAAQAFDAPGVLRVTLQRAGESAVIRVQDCGRGMAREQVERLFDVDFSRAARVQARFGLPLCRSIVHRHGGQVRVESEPGRGTTVIIELPLSA